MNRWQVILCCIWLIGAGALAQANPRDYVLSPSAVAYAEDQAVITFDIRNQGGDALEATAIRIASINQGGDVSAVMPAHLAALAPLHAGETVNCSIEFNLAGLPDGDYFYEIAAGIDAYEVADSPIAADNVQWFRLTVADAPPAASQSSAPIAVFCPQARALLIPLLNIRLRPVDGGLVINGGLVTVPQLLAGAAGLVLALFLLWLLLRLLRWAWRGAPKFETWQPPYALQTHQDPDSTAGRRQSWQHHAQNSGIFAPCAPNHVAVIKRLTDLQGLPLGGWRIKALRTAQYDPYGRINRSEVIMPHKLAAQLNRLIPRAGDDDSAHLQAALQPIAKGISRAAVKPISRSSLMLPIALDIRFEGTPGEVQILFELYQCRSDAWHLIDQWQPELGAIGARIPENFTYTVNGLLPGETPREFKQRLPDEIARILGSLFHHQQHPDPEKSKRASPSDA